MLPSSSRVPAGTGSVGDEPVHEGGGLVPAVLLAAAARGVPGWDGDLGRREHGHHWVAARSSRPRRSSHGSTLVIASSSIAV
jgi:hypothetical protein